MGAALMSAAMAASAATVVEPGKTVNFVYDDSALGLFGTPHARANSNELIFDQTSFFAKSLNSEGAALTNSTILISVVALNSATRIGGISLSEVGDYVRDGQTTEVSAEGGLLATNLENGMPPYDFEPIVPMTAPKPTMWKAGASIDTSGWDVSSLEITVENLLRAKSLHLGDTAFIEKKLVSLTVSTVPIPGAALLFGPGLMAAFAPALRRRKKPAAA
jgi:hypothetical protein